MKHAKKAATAAIAAAFIGGEQSGVAVTKPHKAPTVITMPASLAPTGHAVKQTAPQQIKVGDSLYQALYINGVIYAEISRKVTQAPSAGRVLKPVSKLDIQEDAE